MARVDVHRVVLLGAGHVGKTALINRFTTGEFATTYAPTLEDLHRHVHIAPDGRALHVEILDTSGSHQFPAMRKLAIQSGRAFIVVYATNDCDSAKKAGELIRVIREARGEEIAICLCANKSDLRSLADGQPITPLLIDEPMDSVVRVEASAKENQSVAAVFEAVLMTLNTERVPSPKPQRERLTDRVIRRLSLVLDSKPVLRRASESDKDDNGDGGNEDFRSRVQSFGGYLSTRPNRKAAAARTAENGLLEAAADGHRFSTSFPSAKRASTFGTAQRHSILPDDPVIRDDVRAVKTFVEDDNDSPMLPLRGRRSTLADLRSSVILVSQLPVAATPDADRIRRISDPGRRWRSDGDGYCKPDQVETGMPAARKESLCSDSDPVATSLSLDSSPILPLRSARSKSFAGRLPLKENCQKRELLFVDPTTDERYRVKHEAVTCIKTQAVPYSSPSSCRHHHHNTPKMKNKNEDYHHASTVRHIPKGPAEKNRPKRRITSITFQEQITVQKESHILDTNIDTTGPIALEDHRSDQAKNRVGNISAAPTGNIDIKKWAKNCHTTTYNITYPDTSEKLGHQRQGCKHSTRLQTSISGNFSISKRMSRRILDLLSK